MSYIAHDIIYRVATKDDADSFKSLLNDNEMSSWVNITLRKEPNYFDADNLMGESVSVIAHEVNDSSKIIGIYACSSFEVYFKAKKEHIIYLNSLRVDVRYRHKIRFLKEGFASIQKLITLKSTKEFMFTSIAKENLKARKLLESNLKGMPTYLPLGGMSSFSFLAKIHTKTMLCQKASAKDIDSIVEFYNANAKDYDFAPVLNSSWLEMLDAKRGLSIDDFYICRDANANILAIFALWDQREIKQIVIHSYKAPLGRFRNLYNLYAKLTANTTLPKESEMLQQIYIAFFTTTSKDSLWIKQLLKEIATLIKRRDANLCTIGFATNSSISKILRDDLKAKEYKTEIEAVYLQKPLEMLGLNIKAEIALL